MRPMLVGTQVKLDFLLYADGDMTSPYRECYLYLNESRPGSVNNLKRQNKNLDPVQE
jgi:lipoprotein NlpI